MKFKKKFSFGGYILLYKTGTCDSFYLETHLLLMWKHTGDEGWVVVMGWVAPCFFCRIEYSWESIYIFSRHLRKINLDTLAAECIRILDRNREGSNFFISYVKRRFLRYWPVLCFVLSIVLISVIIWEEHLVILLNNNEILSILNLLH